MRLRTCGAAALAVMLEACASASNPVRLNVAIRTIEVDLQKAAVLPLSDLSVTDSARAGAAARSIYSYQCFYGTANPVIAVLTSQFTLGLQGTFTQGGKVGAGATGPVPSGSIEYDVSGARQQTLTVPMAFVTVSDLPALYLSQNLAYLNGIADAQKKPLVENLLKNENDLAARLSPIIAAFPSRQAQCPKDSQGHPLPPTNVVEPQLF